MTCSRILLLEFYDSFYDFRDRLLDLAGIRVPILSGYHRRS